MQFIRSLLSEVVISPEAFQVVESKPVNEQSWASLAVFTQLFLLAFAFIVGRVLERHKISWLGEAGFALLLGVCVGVLVKVFANSETFIQWIAFKKEFFFIALLPPIIFDAGFSLKVKPFFQNIGAIAVYAFAGTTISTFVIAFIVWAAGWLGICTRFSFLEASLFGAIVSATDPVSVLAIFQRLHADENLYALVFGESVLNDAVAIVLYRTLTIFLDVPVSFPAILHAVGTFIGVFVGSMCIGVLIALLASLMLKSKYFRSQHLPLESCLLILFAYSCYMLADGCGLSGIVAILFCGMVMAHYCLPSLSSTARDRTAAFSKMLATLAETFVFIYVGATLFLEKQAWDKGLTWAFLGVSLVALAVSRAANVYPCTLVVNFVRTPDMRVPQSHAFMLWFSGLRGAMAFALSLEAADDLPDSSGRVILTSTFFIVLITVLVNGGSCTYLLEKLGLKGESHAGAGYHIIHVADLQDSQEPGAGTDSPGPAASHLPGYSGDSQEEVDTPRAVLAGPATLFANKSPAAAASPPGSERGAANLLSRSLTKVRELNREGVLSKLNKIDQRFLSKMFMPSQMSEDAEAASAQLVTGGATQVHASAVSQDMDRDVELAVHVTDGNAPSTRAPSKGSSAPHSEGQKE